MDVFTIATSSLHKHRIGMLVFDIVKYVGDFAGGLWGPFPEILVLNGVF